jgi:predicted DNA-binding transcriptional regulator AlpA
MSTLEQHDYPLDHVHRWKDWYRLAGLSAPTAWRLLKSGQGPIVTKLSARLTGVRHRHHLAWLTAREQHQQDTAA